MPEFVLNGREKPEFRALSYFVQGYIEAMFFTECSPVYDMEEWFTDERREASEEGQSDGELPGDSGFAELHKDALARIVADCERFETENEELLAQAYELEPGSESFRYARNPIDSERAGMLFWYSRNGHGVGWTDDGDAPCLKALQKAGRAFSEVQVWFGDHVEHGDAPFVHVQ